MKTNKSKTARVALARQRQVKRVSPAISEKSVGAVVFSNEDGIEYLLVFSTFWEFPKGRVDANESETETARREIREETGLEVEFVEGFRDEINYFFRRNGKLIKKQVVFFLTRAKTRAARLSSEHSDFVWLYFDAALEKLTYENSRAVLRKANAFIVSQLES